MKHRGIGRVTALLAAGRGAKVVAAGRDEKPSPRRTYERPDPGALGRACVERSPPSYVRGCVHGQQPVVEDRGDRPPRPSAAPSYQSDLMNLPSGATESREDRFERRLPG